MSNITWLHLSDWHQKGQDFDRGVVRDALIKDIRDRERIDPALAQVDFVVFSGDLAFSGEPAEYEAARQNFLDPVMDAVGLDPSRMFIVPGNHDLNREIVYEMLPPELQKPLDSDVLVQKWLSDQKRERTLEPFEAYRKFVYEYTGQPTPDYASIVRLEAGGTQVALLGLNSAWMTARNRDLNGEIHDYGYTLIGEPQLHSAIEQIADAELRIAVLHHPFDWLYEFDRNRTEARVGRECHFILRGHMHNQQVSVMRGTAGECVIIPAGASYKRRIAEDPRYTNSYNWVHLDLDAGSGVVYLRRWSDPRNKWIEDTDVYDGGKFTLDNLPKEVGKKKASAVLQPAASLKAAGAPRFEHERNVLEGYLNALIRNNTDLEPGGIKQTKVRVVLPLDSIYVGLQADRDRPDVDRRVMQEELEEIKKNLEREEDPKEREKQYQIWAHHSRVIQQALEISGPREDLSTIVQRHRQVVILGDPGSGKTTLVRYLTLRLARAVLAELERLFEPQELWDAKKVWQAPDLGPVRLPILLRISHYAEARQKDPDLALVDYLPRYFAGLSIPQADTLGPILQRLLDEGRCMILLDGLDEIIDPTDRRNIASAIGQFASVYRETGLPDWLAHSLTHVTTRKEERLASQTMSEGKEEEISIQWDKDIPEEVRIEWGKQIKQRQSEWRRRGRAVRLAWELLGEARYAHVGNRFVVTSRIAGYHFAGVPGEFEHFTIRRMSLEDIKLFLEKWCPAVERRIAEAPDPSQVEQRARREIEGILKAVETTPGVRRMAENPLLLRILAIIHRNEAHLPQRRIELYETASVTLLRDWHLERGTPKGAVIDDVKATSLLGPLALYIHENRASGFLSKGETERFLSSILARERGEKDPEQPSLETREAVQDFLETVREHSGLFVERGEGLYGFMHLTFEEYFTARQLVSSAARARSQILGRLHMPRWREPILLAVGSLSKQFYDDTHELLRAILEAGSPYEKFLHRDLLFAAACVGDSVNVAPVLRQEIAGKLLALYCDRRGAGRFRLLQQQVKDALLTLCNDQGDTAVEDALAEIITSRTGNITLDCVLDVVEWLGARTPAVAKALAAHPNLEALPRAQELLRNVQARLPVNSDVARPAVINWDTVRNDLNLADLLALLWLYGWRESLNESLNVEKDVLADFSSTLQHFSTYRVLDLARKLVRRINDTPTDKRDPAFWKSLAEELGAMYQLSIRITRLAAAARDLAQVVVECLKSSESTMEAAQNLWRVIYQPVFRIGHDGATSRGILTFEQVAAEFQDAAREAEDTLADIDIDGNLRLVGLQLLKGASSGDTLIVTLTACAARLSTLQSSNGKTSLLSHVQAVGSGVGNALLSLLSSPVNGQQYREAAFFLLPTPNRRLLRNAALTGEAARFGDQAAAIICADLESEDFPRRRLALQTLTRPSVRERAKLSGTHLSLLQSLLDSSTDQAKPALEILFAMGLRPELLSWCWSALRRRDHPLSDALVEQLDTLKAVEGSPAILALLDEGLRDEILRSISLDLMYKLAWSGTDTLPQALTWLRAEDSQVRHLAALLLSSQADSLGIVFSALASSAVEQEAYPAAPAWSDLGRDKPLVRLLAGLWLHGWDDALSRLLVATLAKVYDEQPSSTSWAQSRTYLKSEKRVLSLLEVAKFGRCLIPVFQHAAARLAALEGNSLQDVPRREHITVVQQEMLRQAEELIAQPDTVPALRAELIILWATTPGHPLMHQLIQEGNHPVAAWLHRTLAEQDLTPTSLPADLARLLVQDDLNIRTAAALALLASDLPTSLVVSLVDAATSPDDRIRTKSWHRLLEMSNYLPTDGSSNAVETLVRLFQDALEDNKGRIYTLLFNAMIGVEYTHPFWIERWLADSSKSQSESKLAFLSLENARRLSPDVLSLVCAELNNQDRSLLARQTLARSLGDILRVINEMRSEASINEALVRMLDDPDVQLRQTAAYFLRWTTGQLAWSTATSLLRVAQTDNDLRTRALSLGSAGRVLHVVRGYRAVDVSKEALFRWMKTAADNIPTFGIDTTDEAVEQLPGLDRVKEIPDADTILAELSTPDRLGLPADVVSGLHDSESWRKLAEDARQEWGLRRYWLAMLPSLPTAIDQVEGFLSAPDPALRRTAACALARLYQGDDDYLSHLHDLLPDDQILLRALLDASADTDVWLDGSESQGSHHAWTVKQIAGWLEAKLPEERALLIDLMLDGLDISMQDTEKEDIEDADGYRGSSMRRILIGTLAELSDRLTYRAFTNTRDLPNVITLFCRAATDQSVYDTRRFAIRVLGNLQQFTNQVAEIFFAACQDMTEVYQETRMAVTKFKVFAAGSLEQLTDAICSPSITVAYHAALLLAELGISRSEDLGREGRERVTDELVQLLDAPLAKRTVYDFSKNIDGTRVGPLYDITYEALVRVVAGPDSPEPVVTQG